MKDEEKQKIQTIGTRIYYSGDMANLPSLGTITKVIPSDKYSPESVKISYDESRFEGDKQSSIVPVYCFEKSGGCRFHLADEWDAEQKKKRELMIVQMKQITRNA